MTISNQDLQRIASLSKLSFSEQEGNALLDDLNRFFQLVEKMDSVDTSAVQPLFHPMSCVQDIALRLREDIADSTDGRQRRQANIQNAPQPQEGFFLVPKVIE